MNKIILFLFFVISFFTFLDISFSHPGNTASDGCHYCRTNCDKWGVARNQRHCHGTSSYSSSYSSYSSFNSYYRKVSNGYFSYGVLNCDIGYTESYNRTYCIKIPDNAHAERTVNGDVWMCDVGYKEVGNKCIMDESKDKLCSNKYPGTVYRWSDDSCICPGNNPYGWDPELSDCPGNKTQDEICNEKYPGTIYRSSDDKCICPGSNGNSWDSKNGCSKINNTKTNIYKTNNVSYGDKLCQKYYGVNSENPNGDKNSEGAYICDCKSGYSWNTNKTKCISEDDILSDLLNGLLEK